MKRDSRPHHSPASTPLRSLTFVSFLGYFFPSCVEHVSCDAPVCVCNRTAAGICDLRKSCTLTCDSCLLQFYIKVIRVYAFGALAADLPG